MRRQVSGSPTATATSAPTRPSRRRPLSPERLSGALFIALLTLLEVLPIQAALLVYAAASTISLAVVFGPLWLIVAALLAFAFARWRLERHSPVWLTIAVLIIGVAAVGLFAGLSPTAYGATPGGLFSSRWLDQLSQDARNDTPRFNSLLVILPIVLYLGWRGLALGATPPRLARTLRRYTISLAVVMLACLGAITAAASLQPSLQSALLMLLALDVFAGLAAASLAHRGAGRESAAGSSDAETLRWLMTALGASALVVAVAIALGLALSLRLALPLLATLRPVGVALNAALSWLANAIAYVLWFIFVNTVGALFFKNTSSYTPPPPPANGLPPQQRHAALAPPPHALIVAVTALIILFVVSLLVWALYLAVRSTLRRLSTGDAPEMDEEREALDARGLLGRQARDLLASLRGRPGGELDPLAAGGVRWLYRETLRAGAAAGVSRRESETADEYSDRLAHALRERGAAESEAGLATLTRAYDDVRYGESAAEASPEALAEARRTVSAVARLRAES